MCQQGRPSSFLSNFVHIAPIGKLERSETNQKAVGKQRSLIARYHLGRVDTDWSTLAYFVVKLFAEVNVCRNVETKKRRTTLLNHLAEQKTNPDRKIKIHFIIKLQKYCISECKTNNSNSSKNIYNSKIQYQNSLALRIKVVLYQRYTVHLN